MNERARPALSFEAPPSELPRRVAYHTLRWLPLVALALLTYALYPAARGFDVPVFELGDVAPVDVVAPFDFAVRKTPAERERDAAALAATVRPIYDYQPAALDSVFAYLGALFEALAAADSAAALMDSAQAHGLRLTVEEARFLLEGDRRASYRAAAEVLARRELRRGVARVAAASAETAREIVLRRNGAERMVPVDSVPGWVEFLERRRLQHPAPDAVIGDQLFVKLLNAAFQPTVLPNVSATDSLRAELRATIDTVKDRVRQNERIVAEHEVVTGEANERLVALRAELLDRGQVGRPDVPATVGRLFSNGLVLAVFWLLLAFYRRETYGSLRQVLVVSVLFALVIGGAAANFRFVAEEPELIPIPFAAMLLTVIFSGRVAMVAATVLAVLIAGQPAYGGTEAVLISLLAGVAAAIGTRMVRRRTQILVTMAAVSAAFAVVAVTVGMQGGWSLAEMWTSALRGTLNALVSGALVSVALPVVEAAAKVTTDLTLLELSDPARPLLRRLATEAPGTYAHSIAMANLCEAACNAIEANGLLARVGCYYHDVGKLKKPQFFVENQGHGTNPHDKLKPEVSAGIIRNHIKEGLQLADEAGLPEVIRAFISEHHGNMEITYFLDRARTRGEQEPPPDQFRYPGPRPRSAETAVAMLADGVEAAVRVLDDPTPEKVRGAIAYLVEQRVASGQLNDAPLTFAQLDRVKAEFLRVLSGVHHNRIDYPAATGGLSADWDAPAPA